MLYSKMALLKFMGWMLVGDTTDFQGIGEVRFMVMNHLNSSINTTIVSSIPGW